MASLKDSAVVNAIKNLDLTLTLEMPIRGPSDSSSCFPSISLELDGTPLKTLEQEPGISGVFTKKDLDKETGN